MGTVQSRYVQVGKERYACPFCFGSNDIRTLRCGHSFCIKCLEVLHKQHSKEVPCPNCRKIEKTEPKKLPTPNCFRGKLLPSPFVDKTLVNINKVINAWIPHRRATVNGLRLVANTLKPQEMKCAWAKVAGSVTGAVGGGMALVGFSLCLTGVGAIVGLPLGITGTAIGAAGGLTTGATVGVEIWLKKSVIDSIQEDLHKDYFRAEQIRVLLSRSAADPNFAIQWKIDPLEAVSFVSMLPRLAKVGVITAAGVRTAIDITAGVGRAAATTGLHVAGIVFAAVLIPVDITQMIFSSIKIHKNEPSKVITDILENAEQLEKLLILFLLKGNYFHFVKCTDTENDPHWVYLTVNAENLENFLKEEQNCCFRYEDISQWGEIIESGEGMEVPQDIVEKIQTEWYEILDAEEENLSVEE